MNPYYYVAEATANGQSLLSLCAGIGLELQDCKSNDITAVDIAPQYIEKLKETYPHIKTVCSDSLEYLKKQPDDSVDIISIIDGIEHMHKADGLDLIKQMKRVAKYKILLFTPEGREEGGYLKNEPHNAWGIEGADEHQKHKSGWKKDELKELGFILLLGADGKSQHGDDYTALMMEWTKDA